MDYPSLFHICYSVGLILLKASSLFLAKKKVFVSIYTCTCSSTSPFLANSISLTSLLSRSTISRPKRCLWRGVFGFQNRHAEFIFSFFEISHDQGIFRLAKGDNFFSGSGMDGNSIVKVLFGGAHLDGDSKTLKHFIGTDSDEVEAYNLLGRTSADEFH